MKNLKKITPGTWVRLALLLAVLTNNTLSALGVNPASGNKAYNIVMVVSTVLVSLASYWKNNSFTDAALTADKLLNELKYADTNG